MADVSVRPAWPEDAERIATVQLETWRAAYADLLPEEVLAGPVADMARVWQQTLSAPPDQERELLVALEGNTLVGLLAKEPSGPGVGEVTALLVHPDHGRQGHGSRLVAAAVDTWRAAGVSEAVTWVWDDDVALTAFLGSCGWAEDGAARVVDTGKRRATQRRWHTALGEG